MRTQIENGQYPGIVKTTLDGFDQRAYLEGNVGQVGAGSLLLFLWVDAVGGALQELEDVLHHVAAWTGRLDYAARPVPLHFGAEHQT